MLQKLEADVRQHIRIEQQLKLHIESIQEKLEEDDKIIEDFNTQKERFKRERARMDEMLIIREQEISALKQEVDELTERLNKKNSKYNELKQELEKAKKTLSQERCILENERKAFSRFNKSTEEARAYSRSNERNEIKSKDMMLKSDLVNQNSISQTALPKKPVSRMYASLYNSNHIKNK